MIEFQRSIHILIEAIQTSFDCRQKVGLFSLKNLRNSFWVLCKLRKGTAHLLDERWNQLEKERLAPVEMLVPKSHGPADDAAQHGVALLVAWPRAVGDR